MFSFSILRPFLTHRASSFFYFRPLCPSVALLFGCSLTIFFLAPAKRLFYSLGFLLPSSILNVGHPLIKAAVRKQNTWPSRSSAESHFASRRLFSTFDPAFLASFQKEALVDNPDGTASLLFTNLQEAHMYRTTPTETPIVGGKNGALGQYAAVGSRGAFLYSNKFKFLDRADVEFLKGT